MEYRISASRHGEFVFFTGWAAKTEYEQEKLEAIFLPKFPTKDGWALTRQSRDESVTNIEI